MAKVNIPVNTSFLHAVKSGYLRRFRMMRSYPTYRDAAVVEVKVLAVDCKVAGETAVACKFFSVRSMLH